MPFQRSLASVLSAVSLLSLVSAAATLAEGGASQGRWIPSPGAVLVERDRVEPTNRLLEDRLDNLLPTLMREADIDLWLIINREYAEDPVYLTLVPEPVFAARRTTMLVFHDRGEAEGVERLTVNRYPLGNLYQSAWQGGDLDEQWQRLAELLAERDPQRIGINVSRDWPVADGLTAGLRDRLEGVLSSELRQRLVSAEDLVVRWIESRSAAELEIYPHVVSLARGVISEAFSERVITPGVTTTDDVAWYLRQRYTDLNLPIWFMPYVNVQRPGVDCTAENPFCGTGGIIHRGDVLHTDVGICYLRLCTDTQEMGYVLKVGEDTVPEALQQALATGNRWQDLLTEAFETGRSGNDILAAARQAADAEGIVSSVYTHPLGHFGHAPGPTIGMWDNQGPTPVRGDWLLNANTAYAIEGNVKVKVPAWDGQWVQIKLEQSAVYDGQGVVYLAGRQTQWHVVR